MAEIVKYHNDVNNVKLGGLNEREINLFFSILFKMKDQNTNILKLSFNELLELEDSKNRSHIRLVNAILRMNKKLILLNQTVKTSRGYITFTLFNRFEIYEDTKELEIQINDTFKYMLNDLISHFTTFDLKTLVHFNSGFSKQVFKNMKQFEGGDGWYKVTLEEFKENMGVSSDYSTANLNNKILKPITRELTPIFKNFKIEKLTKDGAIAGRGKKAYWLMFSWDKGKTNQVEAIQKAEIVEDFKELDEAIKRAKRNIHISRSWNKRAENKIHKIAQERGEAFACEILNGIYGNLKEDIKTTLVQYINGVLKNYQEEEAEAKEKIQKKVEPIKQPLKVEEKPEEPKKELQTEYSEEDIQKAIKKCVEAEGMAIGFLEVMRKKSNRIFMTSIKRYLEN